MKIKLEKSTLNFLQNSILAVISSLFIGIGGYLIRRILANSLSIDDFAFFYFFMACTTILNSIFNFGTPDMLLFNLRKSNQANEADNNWSIFSTVCRFNLYIFTTISIVYTAYLLLLSKNISYYFTVPYFILFVFDGIFYSTMNSLKLFNLLYLLQVSRTLLLVIFAYILSSHQGVVGAISAFSLTLLITGTVFLIYLRRMSQGKCFQKPDWEIFRSRWSSCLCLQILSFNPMIFNELATIMLSFFSSTSEIATFNIALPVAMIIRSFYCIGIVLIPFVGEMKYDNNYAKIRTYLHCGIGVVLLACLCMIPFFHTFGKWMLCLLFGEKFQNAAFSAFLLSETMLIAFIGQMNINILNTLNKEKESSILTLATVAFSIILYAISAKFGGSDWTSAACLLSAILWSSLSYIALTNKLNQTATNKSCAK